MAVGNPLTAALRKHYDAQAQQGRADAGTPPAPPAGSSPPARPAPPAARPSRDQLRRAIAQAMTPKEDQ